MVSSPKIRVHERFIDLMGNVARPIAEEMKKRYGLDKITLDHATITYLIARKHSRKKAFNFRIVKTSRNEGRLVLL